MEYVAFWIFCSIIVIGTTIISLYKIKCKQDWRLKFPDKYLEDTQQRQKFELDKLQLGININADTDEEIKF